MRGVRAGRRSGRRGAFLVSVGLVALGGGCEKDSPAPAERKETRGPETVGVRDVVDYATGAMPVEMGNRMKDQVRRIEAEREKQLEQALDE